MNRSFQSMKRLNEHPRCGHEFVDVIEIPIGVEIKTAPSGRPYYISGQTAETTIIRYTDDGTFKEVDTKKIR